MKTKNNRKSTSFLYLFFFLTVLLLAIKVCPVQTQSQNNNDDENDNDNLPPMLDSDDISYFSSVNELDNLHYYLKTVFERSERNPDPSKIKHELPHAIVSKGGGSFYTSDYKLKLDIEQAEYLVQQQEELSNEMKTFLVQNYIPILSRVRQNIQRVMKEEGEEGDGSSDGLKKTHGLYAFRDEDWKLNIKDIYNKALYVPDMDLSSLVDGGDTKKPKNSEILFSKDFNPAKIQKEWQNCIEKNEPGVVVVDNLLSEKALKAIRQILYESTVWYQTKMPYKFGGYVGAYIDDGLYQKILLELAFELRNALPEIMQNHFLKYMWAYKYDSDYTGINTHADQAAVNVNIWITPSEANLDPNSGGLVIYTTKPPLDWNFQQFNSDMDRIQKDILKPSGFQNITVPYKENRAIIFDSALFHHTDTFKFKKGYTNRRINLTILYGEMQQQQNEKRKDEL